MLIESSTVIPLLKRITPQIHRDMRGEFVETFSLKTHIFQKEDGAVIEFLEDDISVSKKNVLRGLHGDRKTWKLIQCLCGSLYFVVVDMRPNSSAFLKWEAFRLDDQIRQQVLVPAGCVNGYLTLSEQCIFGYKQSAYYSGAGQQLSVRWNDPKLKIEWPVSDPVLSERDATAPLLSL
jgi:dTDP-4-dehydrorhamnose 3,5-epimerase